MDNIKVAIRVRPMISREQKTGCKSNWLIRDNTMAPMENGRVGSSYAFDKIFDETKTTYDIFAEICKPVITGAVQGFHGTIFAYGQSSSGKTFTMTGSADSPGIISLSMEEIFKQMKHTPDKEFLLRISYMEIYNEKVSDLLSSEDKPIRIQEDLDKNILLTGVSEELVMSIKDVQHYMDCGNDRKHMAETKQNDRSSRSHCIMRVIIESRETGDEDAVMVSHLNFVDLAGSEKAHENSGDRYKEGCAINKSLFMLGTVISKLSDGVSHQHIGYRDSKLTRILQNALGGNSKTAIIATITPASVEESHSTLRFASRAKTIKNAPHVNETLSDAALLKRSRKEIFVLQKQIEELKSKDALMQKEEMQRKLEEKMEQERKHMETIDKLKQFIIKAEIEEESNFKKLKRRRETWCPGKAKLQELPASKFARDLSGQRIDVEIERPAIPKSFVTSRKDDALLDTTEFLGDVSMPNDESMFLTEFPPKFADFSKQKQRHVSFRSPESDTDSFNQGKEFRRLQDKYEDLMQMYEEKCRMSDQDHSYMVHELGYVKEELEKEKNNPTNNKIIEDQKTELKKIQGEKNDLVDEVVLLQHRLSIQSRKVEECMNELTSLRSNQNEQTAQSTNDGEEIKKLTEEKDKLAADLAECMNELTSLRSNQNEQMAQSTNDGEEIKKLTEEKDKLAADLADFKNIKEELQHQHETSLEMYIMKIQELEEKIEENAETLNSQKDKIANLSDETKALQSALTSSEEKMSEAVASKGALEKEVEELKLQSKEKDTDAGVKTTELDTSKELISQQETRIADLEKEIVQLYTKLKVQTGVDGPRRSTADELSDVLKEHCEDLESRLREAETENVILKEKLEKAVSLAQINGPRRSTADELSEVLKEHCEDLETRLKEMENENAELKEKLETLERKSESSETIERYGKDLKELEEKLNELETENTDLKRKLETQEMKSESIKTVESSGEDLNEKLLELESENSNLKLKLETLEMKSKSIETMESSGQDLKEKLMKLESENSNLKLKLETLEMKSESTETVESSGEDLKEKLMELEFENTGLKEKLAALKLETMETEGNQDNAHVEEIKSLKTKCAHLDNMMKELREENDVLRKKNESSDYSGNADRNCTEDKTNSLHEEMMKELKKTIELKEQEIVRLTEDLKSKTDTDRKSDASVFTPTKDGQTDMAKNHCASLEQSLKELRTENENLQEKVGRLTEQLAEEDKCYIKSLEGDKDQMKEENSKLHEINRVNHEKIAHLQLQLVAFGEKLRADSLSENNRRSVEMELTDVYKEHCQDLETRVADVEAENQRLLSKIEKLISDSNKVEELEREIIKLEVENEELRSGMASVNTRLTQEIPSVSPDGQQATIHEEYKQQLQLLEKNIENLESEKNDLSKKLATVLNEKVGSSGGMAMLESLESQIKLLEDENNILLDKLHVHSNNASEVETLESNIKLLVQENQCTLEKLEAEKKLSLELESKVEILEEQLKSSKKPQDVDTELLQEMNCKITELEAQNKELSEKLECSPALVSQDLDEKICTLQEENRCLKEKLSVEVNDTMTSKHLELEVENKALVEKLNRYTEQTMESNEKVESEGIENQIDMESNELVEKNRELVEKAEAQNYLVLDLKSKIEHLENENRSRAEKLKEFVSSQGKLEEPQKMRDDLDRKSITDDEAKKCLLEELDCKVKMLEEENGQLRQKLDELKDIEVRNHELRERIQNLENRTPEPNVDALAELHSRYTALEEENKKLVEKLEEYDQSSATIDELKDKIQKLESRSVDEMDTDKHGKILELECKVEVLEEENRTLLTKLEEDNESQSQIQELQEKIVELEGKSEISESFDAKVLELECKVEVLEEENKSLMEKLDLLSENQSHNVELQERIRELEEQNFNLSEKTTGNDSFVLKELQCQVDSLESEKKDLVERLEIRSEDTGLLSIVSLLEKENQDLLQKLEDKNDHQSEAITHEINSLKEKNQNLSDTIDKEGMKLKEFLCKISTQYTVHENDELKTLIDALLESVEKLEVEKQVVKDSNETLIEKVVGLETKCDQAETELNLKSDELDVLQTKLTESECKVEVLQEEYDSLCKKIDDMVERTRYEELECKAEVLQEENENLSKKLQELEEHNEISKHQESKLGDLSNEAETLRTKNEKLASELEDVRFELSKLSKLKDRADKRIEDLKGDIEIIKSTEQVFKNDNESLMQEISTVHEKYKEKIQAEKEKCEGLESEIDSLKQKLTVMISNEDLQQKLTDIDKVWKEKLERKQDIVDKQLKLLSEMKVDRDVIEQDLRRSESEKLEILDKSRVVEKEVRELRNSLEKLEKENEEKQAKIKSLESGAVNESMSTSERTKDLDEAAKARIVKLFTENNKLKERNAKDSKLIEIQQNSIQRLEQELEKKDRSNELYDKMKELEQEHKKANEDADKYYNLFCDEELKASKLKDEIRQKNVEIDKLKQDISGMESQGFVKTDEKSKDELRILKKRFTETYNELQEAKKTVSKVQKEMGDKNIRILVLEGNVRDNEEHHKRELKAYVESYEMMEERAREYKNKIRELENQNCQDDTMSNFNAVKKDSNFPIGRASTAGGAVDHFNNILLEEENRKLLSKVLRYEKKIEKLMHELQRYQKEKKENPELEKKVAELREEEKKLRTQIDEHQRAPLTNVNTMYDDFFTTTEPTSVQKPKKRTDNEEGCAQQ